MANEHQLGSRPHGSRLARERHGQLQDVLNRFARAITAGDGETCKQVWQTPAFVIGDQMVMTVTSDDEVAQFFGAGKAQYTERGIVDTRPDIVDEEWLGDDLVVVKVRWPYLDSRGREVGAERSDYTLKRDDAGHLRIRSALMRGIEPARKSQRHEA